MTWLRRNLVALIVLALAIPGLALVVLWLPILDEQGEKRVTVVAQGDSIDEGGYRFTLMRSEEFVGTGNGPGGNKIPIGSSLIGAIMAVTPLDKPLDNASCTIKLTERRAGQELSWQQVSDERQFDYEIGEDRTAYCVLHGTAIEVETVFLTPTGTYRHATIDVTGIGDALDAHVYRFALVH